MNFDFAGTIVRKMAFLTRAGRSAGGGSLRCRVALTLL